MDPALIIPAFIAGVITFLAPCTLPLVPGYIGFISGLSVTDLRDPKRVAKARPKIFLNGLLYVGGFSAVFILLGSLFGLGGAALVKYRVLLARLGGLFVIFFGLYIMNALGPLRRFFSNHRLPVIDTLNQGRRLHLAKNLTPGKPASSLIFGAAFAFGWTPCVGPVLGSILLLASTSGTVGQGAFLLGVFSLGLAAPFLLVTLGVGSALSYLKRIDHYLRVVEVVGGIFLVLLGLIMVTNNFTVWLSFVYRTFSFVNFEERLFNYL